MNKIIITLEIPIKKEYPVFDLSKEYSNEEIEEMVFKSIILQIAFGQLDLYESLRNERYKYEQKNQTTLAQSMDLAIEKAKKWHDIIWHNRKNVLIKTEIE